jgi:geranyl-CoA carboxylase alpha subunit
VALAQQQGSSWRPDSVAAYGFNVQCAAAMHAVRVKPGRDCRVQVTMNGTTVQARVVQWAEGVLRVEVKGVQQTAIVVMDNGQLHLAHAGHTHVFAEVSPFPSADALIDASRARSPVAGKVTQVLVTVGDSVQPGQQLVCVEAMKMEMWLCAEGTGTVKAMHAKTGEQVESAAVLVELDLAA